MNNTIQAFILDLDGTVYRGAEEVPGAGVFVRRMRAQGRRCLFVTNRSNRVSAEVAAQIEGYGIPCGAADVLTTAQATAACLPPGRVYCIGEQGLRTELEAAGHVLVSERVDYVVVSFDRTFSYAKLAEASRLILAGARFVATNTDRALNTEDGIQPGSGAIVAAVAAVVGSAPQVIGKPERLIFDMALRHLGLPRERVVVIGDNWETDILAADRAGLRSALILTGITTRSDLAAADVQPTWVVESYEQLTRLVEEA